MVKPCNASCHWSISITVLLITLMSFEKRLILNKAYTIQIRQIRHKWTECTAPSQPCNGNVAAVLWRPGAGKHLVNAYASSQATLVWTSAQYWFEWWRKGANTTFSSWRAGVPENRWFEPAIFTHGWSRLSGMSLIVANDWGDLQLADEMTE